MGEYHKAGGADWCWGRQVAYGTNTGWWEESKGWGSNKDFGVKTCYGETAEEEKGVFWDDKEIEGEYKLIS